MRKNSIKYLSLKVPGSDSSAFTTKYLGTPSGFARTPFHSCGKPAPPRPLRPEVFTSSTIWSGVIFNAFLQIGNHHVLCKYQNI